MGIIALESGPTLIVWNYLPFRNICLHSPLFFPLCDFSLAVLQTTAARPPPRNLATSLRCCHSDPRQVTCHRAWLVRSVSFRATATPGPKSWRYHANSQSHTAAWPENAVGTPRICHTVARHPTVPRATVLCWERPPFEAAATSASFQRRRGGD